MRVLVTGATGFVGKRLCERLLTDGHTPLALVRGRSDTSGLEALGVRIDRRGFDDIDALVPLLHEVDAIVHAAGTGKAARAEAFVDANVTPTRALAAAAARAPVRRFVLISSLSAQGPSADGTRPPANISPNPQSAYGESKRDAERIVQSALGARATVLRPPPVYGPGDDAFLPLFRAAARGVVPLHGRGKLTSIVHVDDLVDAIVRLAALPETAPVYGVDDGIVHRWEDIAAAIGVAVGQPRITTVAIPAAALRSAAALAESWARLRGTAVFFSRDKVRDVLQPHWVCSADSLAADTGYAAKVTLAAGLAETAAWYRAAGWL